MLSLSSLSPATQSNSMIKSESNEELCGSQCSICSILPLLDSTEISSSSSSLSYEQCSPIHDEFVEYSHEELEEDTPLIAHKLCALDCDIIFHISEFVTRAEHFKIWTRVSYRFNELFSVRRYFDPSFPVQTRLFERDATYYRQCVKPFIIGGNNSSVAVVNNIAQNTVNLRFSVKYYLLFYDRFIALQQRYKRQMQPRYHKLESRNDNSTSRQCSLTFSSVLSTIQFNPRIAAFNNDEMRWVVSLLRFNTNKRSLLKWDFSNCHLNDSHLSIIGSALLSREHFSPLRSLNLSHNSDITDQSMATLFAAMGENCPKIKSINLNQTKVGNQTCAIVGAYFCKYIDLLSLSDMPNIQWRSTDVTSKGERMLQLSISSKLGGIK